MEDESFRVSDSTHINIPIRNLVAIGIALTLFLAQFFTLTSRIGNLEEGNRRYKIQIEKNTEFRYRWPRGELGMVAIDVEQDIRLDHLESDINTLRDSVGKHADKAKEHN